MSEIKTVLLFPGSFNPPTFGHMKLLAQAVETIRPDVSLVLPVWRSECSQAHETDAWYRRNMVREAVDNSLPLPLAAMVDTDSHCELRGEDPGSTHLLVRHYADAYPGAKLWILLGRAGAREAFNWRKGREMAKCASITVSRDVDPMDLASLHSKGFEVRGLPKKPSLISPAQCREMLSRGKATRWRYMPRRVVTMAEEHGLYGSRRPQWALK